MKRKLLIRHSWQRHVSPIKPYEPTWTDLKKDKQLKQNEKDKSKEKDTSTLVKSDEATLDKTGEKRKLNTEEGLLGNEGKDIIKDELEDQEVIEEEFDPELELLKSTKTINPTAYKKLKGLKGLFPKFRENL